MRASRARHASTATERGMDGHGSAGASEQVSASAVRDSRFHGARGHGCKGGDAHLHAACDLILPSARSGQSHRFRHRGNCGRASFRISLALAVCALVPTADRPAPLAVESSCIGSPLASSHRIAVFAPSRISLSPSSFPPPLSPSHALPARAISCPRRDGYVARYGRSPHAAFGSAA
jgi:hypothetical protein